MPTRATPHLPILTATLSTIFLTGSLTSLSLLTIPSLAASASVSVLISQFRNLHRLDRLLLFPTTLATSLLWYLAVYQAYVGKLRWRSLALAGTCLLASLGFEHVVMEPVSRALGDEMHYHERDLERNDGEEEGGLLARWGRLNWGRVVMMGFAGGVGVRALL
jgi:hypothetical protein